MYCNYLFYTVLNGVPFPKYLLGIKKVLAGLFFNVVACNIATYL